MASVKTLLYPITCGHQQLALHQPRLGHCELWLAGPKAGSPPELAAPF